MNWLLGYLCVGQTAMFVLLAREQRSAFQSRTNQAAERKHTLEALDDLVEAGLIELELKDAGRNRRQPIVAGGRAQDESHRAEERRQPVDGSLDLVHDLILRTASDDRARA